MTKISLEHIKKLYSKPLLDLVFEAAQTHRKYHKSDEIQMCKLLSIKTGGCTEDCAYCAQSIHYNTNLKKEKLMTVDAVMKKAKQAKKEGATRFCMGAAWREVSDGRAFDRVLSMVEGIKAEGLETCCTLGMVTLDQAKKLKKAGLTAYNHNLDTSNEHYENIITTRTYKDRLETIENVSKAGISVCCGGILGLEETHEDRISLIYTLANLDPQPESIPINTLGKVKGTPLEKAKPVDVFDWVHVIAIVRLLIPKAKVRLSAGRLSFSSEAQALAFMAGANAIFMGYVLLTIDNVAFSDDKILMERLGLKGELPKFSLDQFGDAKKTA